MLGALIVPIALVLSACGGAEESAPEPAPAPAPAPAPEPEAEALPGEGVTIRIGFIPGPYADLVRGGIAPILEADGYTVEINEISDFTVPNQATMDGDLDANIFQNDAFMNLYNGNNAGDLVSLIKIPSAPLGLYPGRASAASVSEIAAGSEFALTSEASNLARSLNFLESLGLVEVAKDLPEGTMATQNDLTANPLNLSFVLVDAPQVPRALPDVDYGVALGNHIYAADGITLSDSIALEEVPVASQITVVVREGNASEAWAQALVAAFESADFRAYVGGDANFAAFHKPDWWG
jgi:D-methionine transport system substrate-binding protein